MGISAVNTRSSESMSTTLPTSPFRTAASLPISGMTCASCVRRVEKAIARVPGVDNVTVNLATERASVSYDPGQTNLNEIAGAVRRVGYDVEDVPSEPVLTLPPSGATPNGRPNGTIDTDPSEAVLPIEGMTCASCVRRVEKSLERVPGVSDAAV